MSLEDRLENELIANLITYLLLKCVEHHRGSSYGYQMKKFVERITGKMIPEGTLYPILSKLADEKKYGYLTSFKENTPGKRFRRHYQLTKRGQEQLKVWPEKFREITGFVTNILKELNEVRV